MMLLLVTSLAPPASAHVSDQTASLSPKNVVPKAGPRGSEGYAKIRSASEIETVCYNLRFEGVGKATAAHIHEGEQGMAGPVVVTFFEDGQGRSSPQDGCVRPVSAGLIESMQTHPNSFYVDVHTNEYPNGAIRGQMRNVEGSYSPPSDCGRFRPAVPDSPSQYRTKAKRAKVRKITDAATKARPVKLPAYTFGPSFWVTSTPIVEDTAFYNLQVDTASLKRGLFIRASWSETSPSEIDLILYDMLGKKVAASNANNLLPVPSLEDGSGIGGPGFEALENFEAEDCSGYTLEVRAVRTTGEVVEVTSWLGGE